MRPGNSRRRIRGEKSVKTRYRESVGGSSANHSRLSRTRVISTLSSRKTEKVETGAFVTKLCVFRQWFRKWQKPRTANAGKAAIRRFKEPCNWDIRECEEAIFSFSLSRKTGLSAIREFEKTPQVKYSKIRKELSVQKYKNPSIEYSGVRKLKNPKFQKNLKINKKLH